MEIFAQGLVGIMDLFIHPNYLSSAYPLGGPMNVAFVIFFIGLIITGIALVVYHTHWKKRKALREPDRPPPEG